MPFEGLQIEIGMAGAEVVDVEFLGDLGGFAAGALGIVPRRTEFAGRPVTGLRRWLTVDQKSARKAEDTIGAELGCGHYYGNAEFMEYQKRVDKIRNDNFAKRRKLDDDMKSDLAAAWLAIKAGKGK